MPARPDRSLSRVLRVLLALAVVSGCASSGTDGGDLFWSAAKGCEARYRTIHVDRVDSDGNVSAHADAETRMELEPFTACYRQAVNTEIEHRGRAGQTAPPLKVQPTVDLD